MKNFPEGNDLGPWDPENFDVEDTAMAMITMKNGMMIYMETAWATNMIQEAPGVTISAAGTKAGADMVGPTFECSVRPGVWPRGRPSMPYTIRFPRPRAFPVPPGRLPEAPGCFL